MTVVFCILFWFLTIFCIKQTIPPDLSFLKAGTTVSVQLNSISMFPMRIAAAFWHPTLRKRLQRVSLLPRQCEELWLASPESGCAVSRAFLLFFKLSPFCSRAHSSVCVQTTEVPHGFIGGTACKLLSARWMEMLKKTSTRLALTK